MAKSRQAMLMAFTLIWTSPIDAQSRGGGDFASQAGAAQRKTLRRAMGLECPPPDETGDIVVCGSREADNARRYRIDPRLVQGPGAPEASRHQQAMTAGSSRCTAVGRDQACNRGLVLMGTGSDKGILGKVMGDN